MASLSFRDVSKSYDGAVLALSHVDLDVDDGEFVVLVGPSGCGKSTLLRSAAGLEELTEGDVFLGGKRVTHLEPGARDVAMVFQNYALYPHMTVHGNMAFALEQRNVKAVEIKDRVAAAARTLGLTPYLDRKPGQLSGGQRQRVAMGRAIVREPQCFLMDEPLSNLDAGLRVQMRAELKLLNQRLGITTLYVTHDQVEAMTMGDRVAVLSPVASPDECNLKQFAAPAELYEKPADLFVARFIGSPAMNIVEAKISGDGESLAAVPGGTDHRLVFPAERSGALAAWRDRPVLIGIRPEHFSHDAQAPVRLDVAALMTEMTGPDGFIFFDLPEAQQDRDVVAEQRKRIVARIEPRFLPEVGRRVSLAVDMSRVQVFDPATGRAIR